MPSPGSIEFGTVTGLILERLESPRRRPCRPRLGYLRWQAEVSQDSLHHRRVFNQRHEAEPPEYLFPSRPTARCPKPQRPYRWDFGKQFRALAKGPASKTSALMTCGTQERPC